MLHKNHPIAEAIKEFKLLEPDHLDSFFEEVKSARPGQNMILTLEDEILIYTVMDISCKAYTTDLGDKMESVNSKKLKESGSSFSEIRIIIVFWMLGTL